MIRGICSVRLWLFVCAFALPGSLALAQCFKTYTYDWVGPVETYQVKMSGTVQVTWNPTARTVTFVTSVSGQGKNPSGDWVNTGASVKLTGPTLQGGARIGSSTIYNGYTLMNGTTVITILAGYSPTFDTACQANTWSGGIKSSGVNGSINMSNLTQAAAAAPNPLVLMAGAGPGEVTFSGALEDGRETVWEVQLLSGPVSVAVDQDENKAIITPTGVGVAELRVRATASACAPASDWENFSVQVSASYCVSWLISNGVGAYATAVSQNKDYADEYKATRNDVEVGVTTVLWGELKQFKIEGLQDATPVKLFKKYTSSPWVWDEGLAIWVKPSGVQLVIESWKFVEEATPVIGCIQRTKGEADGDYLPPEVVNPVDPANPKPPPTDAPPAPPVTTTTTTPDGGTTGGKLITGPLWSSSADDTALTGKLYQEGVTHIVKELQAVNDKLANAPGSANDSAIAGAAAEGAGATDGEGNGTGAGAASDAVAQSMDGGPNTPTVSLPSGSGSGLSIVGAYGVNINLNPASNPLVSSLADFLKQVVTWLAGLGFAWWCWGEFDRAVRHLLHTEQAKGNAIVGGTGGQATALIAAGAITALLLAVPLAFWAFATYDITPVSNPSGPGSIALYLLFFFLPVPYLLSLVTAAFVVRKAALVLVAATATLIRFVVP